MIHPLIGLTVSRQEEKNRTLRFDQAPYKHTLAEAYIQAVIRAGGIPVLLPFGLPEEDLHSAVSRLQGVLFTGGGDIDPAVFNGKPHPKVGHIDPVRDEMEITLMKFVTENNIPFLAICRGIQIMNVTFGGTLFTDLDDHFSRALRHDCHGDFPRDYLAHEVSLQPDSRIANIIGTDVTETNSLHHQGLAQIAPPLKPVGHTSDGLVEAVEIPEHIFGIGVQWHPECLPESQPMQNLFSVFAETCRENSNQKQRY